MDPMQACRRADGLLTVADFYHKCSPREDSQGSHNSRTHMKPSVVFSSMATTYPTHLSLVQGNVNTLKFPECWMSGSLVWRRQTADSGPNKHVQDASSEPLVRMSEPARTVAVQYVCGFVVLVVSSNPVGQQSTEPSAGPFPTSRCVLEKAYRS